MPTRFSIPLLLSLVFAPIVSWVIALKLRAKYSLEVEAKRSLMEEPSHLEQY